MSKNYGWDLMGRIGAIESRDGVQRPELKARIAELCLQGKDQEAADIILDEFARVVGAERAGDYPEGDPNICFRNLTDEEFFEAVKNPQPFATMRSAIQRPAQSSDIPAARVQSFKDVSDDDFFASLKNL